MRAVRNAMREAAAIVRPHDQTLDAAVREITIAFGRAADATNKAVSYRVEAGMKLLALRKRIEAGEAGDGVNWWKWFGQHFDRSRKDAEKVMAQASADDPETAAEEERAKDRDRKRQQRAKGQESQPKDTADVRGNEPEAPTDVRKPDPQMERDRKECVALYRKVVNAERELLDAEASAEARKASYAENEDPKTFAEWKGVIAARIEGAWNVLSSDDWEKLRKLLIGTLENLYWSPNMRSADE